MEPNEYLHTLDTEFQSLITKFEEVMSLWKDYTHSNIMERFHIKEKLSTKFKRFKSNLKNRLEYIQTKGDSLEKKFLLAVLQEVWIMLKDLSLKRLNLNNTVLINYRFNSTVYILKSGYHQLTQYSIIED